MIGRSSGFISLLKVANHHELMIQCAIHWQHLVTKNMNGRLNLSLKRGIKAVNKIEAHALNTRLFKQLRNEND